MPLVKVNKENCLTIPVGLTAHLKVSAHYDISYISSAFTEILTCHKFNKIYFYCSWIHSKLKFLMV